MGQSIGRVDARDMVTGKKQFTMDLADPERAADHGLPAADTQRHRAVDQEPRAGQGDARRHRRRRDLPWCGRACAHLRPVHRRHPRPQGRRGAPARSTTRTATASPRRSPSVLLPMAPALPTDEVIEEDYVFHYRSGSPLETNCAIADVRGDTAEVWARAQDADRHAAAHRAAAGHPRGQRHRALRDRVVAPSAGTCSRTPPTRRSRPRSCSASRSSLMWHRTDDSRHGRMHPMMVNRVRATKNGQQHHQLHHEQRQFGVRLDPRSR